MSMYRMVVRRVKRVIAWVLAVIVLVLLAAGGFYILTEVL